MCSAGTVNLKGQTVNRRPQGLTERYQLHSISLHGLQVYFDVKIGDEPPSASHMFRSYYAVAVVYSKRGDSGWSREHTIDHI